MWGLCNRNVRKPSGPTLELLTIREFGKNERGRALKKPTSPKKSKPALDPVETAAIERVPPIVGIGASAGGLEALEQFMARIPMASGLAFVVVQHLDPTHKGIMVELLQRSTLMSVVQIQDHMKVEANHVYVIPPNRDLSILRGVLHLLEPVSPRGLRLPIDHFFRALADDQQERSIGVILSGMGSDGTLGLRAIKEKAGSVFVQTPASAKFDGMPRSAIDAGLADVVAPAEELAARILLYLQHVPLLSERSVTDRDDRDQSALDKVVLLLRSQTGHDFSLYKKSTIYRRVERRMGLHQLPKIADYVRFLRANPQETDLLFKELLIGVTSFFRDPAVWDQLKAEVFPTLLAAHPGGATLRAWVPACSSGEEAYSLAMCFCEALEEARPAARYALQIFATDLDSDAITRARTAVYPANIAADLSEARLRRYFVQEERGYRVGKDIREMVIFAPQNLVMDPPFTKLDLLSCRNLLIYLEGDLQKKLLPLFHYSLNSGGFLLLGNSETVGGHTDLFAQHPGKLRIYQRQTAGLSGVEVQFPSAVSRLNPGTRQVPPVPPLLSSEQTSAHLQAQTEALLLQHFSPAALLTTPKGDIVFISGKTGKYLEPAAGKANLNVFAMARVGLSDALYSGFAKALRSKEAVSLASLPVGSNGGTRHVDVTIQPLTSPPALAGMMLIVLADVATPPEPLKQGKQDQASLRDAQLAAKIDELQQAREELQTTREEMQTSQEELKSSNEELQSTNEELQSTNEELTTSKEEMQSMNEELQTVNHELQAKVDELSQASDDMKNLLNSTDIATLFLDEELRVRRFTPQINSIISLIPGDADRPITDLVTQLDYSTFVEDVKEVLRTLIYHERQVATRDGRWFKVRIMPYRTQSNRIDGVVITFVNISDSKVLEVSLRDILALLESRFLGQVGGSASVADLDALLRKTQTVLDKRFLTQLSSTTPPEAPSKPSKG